MSSTPKQAAASATLEVLEQRIAHELELESSSVTAFAADGGLGVVVRVSAALRRMLQPDALAQAIFRAANEPLRALVLAEAIEPAPAEERRLAYAERYRAGALDGFAAYRDGQVSSTVVPNPPSLEWTATQNKLQAIWREVLQCGEIDPEESFFALGGNSIAAAQILARVRERLGVSLDYAGLAQAATLRELAALIDRTPSTSSPWAAAIPRVGRASKLPLSAVQRQMYILWQLDPDSAAYNVSGGLRLCGALDRIALQRAMDALVERHEALRTRFPEHAGEPYQHIDLARPVLITERSVRGELEPLLRAEASDPFDLARGPLLRVLLAHVRADEHVLVVTLHHSVADGASMNVLLQEFAQLYAAFARAETPLLAAPALQYADYAAWQAARLDAGEAARQLQYWLGELGDAQPVLSLPSDRPRPKRASQRGARLAFPMSTALVADLRALARMRGVSLFVVLLAAFKVLLYRYTQQRDLRVGVPSANRLRTEAEHLLGAFVNTSVLRSRMDGEQSFGALLAQLNTKLAEAQSHQELPFEQLVEAISPERSAAHNPLFQVMYNHQQRDLRALSRLPGLRAELLEIDSGVSRFDLSLNTQEDTGGALSAWFVYSVELFERGRMQRMAAHYLQLLAALSADPDRPIALISPLGVQERARIDGFGLTSAQARPAGFVHEWFAAQAQRSPHACALVFGTETLDYAELALRVQRLARLLRAHGAGPDRIVGVLLPRSLDLVIALLGILESGAAYLPLDPDLPAPRLSYMLEDAGAQLLLTHSALRDVLPAKLPALAIDQLPDLPLPAAEPVRLHAHNLAYVLYTSGTTGKPKAVASTHGALAERLAWMQREYGLAVHETLLHKTPLGFDVAVWEIFWPLATGARLAIAAPGAQRDPQLLARLIQTHEVSTIHFVPSLLREFVATPEARACRTLRRLFSGGEALTPDLQARALDCLPGVRLDNRYGPTEALINATFWTCSRQLQTPVPIGRPIPGTSVRILDAALQPVPIGVPGELYIGGACLARGYLGRAGLTAAHFLPDPFARAPGQRLYRSGDWARFRDDGAIEYLGRRDDQVKVRGVRIELGELESLLRTLPEIDAAVALLRAGPGGSARIVAYVTGRSALDRDALMAELEARLPAQLVPAQIVQLERLPLLASGKLDRVALPEPIWQTRAHVAPVTALERRLAALWQEVLQVERVGLHDDFFALGGHSLLATQLVSRVRAQLDIELALRELFDARSLGEFALRVQRALDGGQRRRQPAIEPADRSRPLPLSYAQERMWFLWSLEPESPAYHVGGAVRLRGPLDVAALERALQALVARHEALRTTFPRDSAGRPTQTIAVSGHVPLEQIDLGAADAAEREAAWRAHAAREAERPFDLERGPLLRVTLLAVAREVHVLLVTLHHIVAEGWAMDVFARECSSLYEAFALGEASPLPELHVQYADYAAWQRRWLESGEAERQLEFWRSTLGDEHPLLELPTDHARPAVRSQRGDYHRFTLDAGFSADVRAFGLRHGVTLSMTLMAALDAFLHRYTGQRQLRLGYPIANRTRPEFEGLIGAFLNTQVLCCELSPELTVAELLECVRQASLAAQEHQDVPFHQIASALAPPRSAAHTPIFQVMCNVQSWQFQQTRSVAGLSLEFIVNDPPAAQFDLALDASDVNGCIECAFSYSLDLFERETAERMARHFVALLRGLIDDPSCRLDALPLLSDAERTRQLQLARGPRAPSPAQPCLHTLFEAQVARTPDAVALVFGAESLRYGELNARANQLARKLRELGVDAEDRVGLCVERSFEAVIAFLAVLKLGACYLPLDPALPLERLRFLAADSGSVLQLTQERLRGLLLSLAAVSPTDLELPCHPDQVAYCIYTSGSTGAPKAVASTHRGLVNRLLAVQAELPLTAADAVLQKTSLSFDVSVGELLWPLLCGARLVIAPAGAQRDPEALQAEVVRHGVTTLDFVPSMLQAFAESGALVACSGLRFITVGGEVLPPELAQRVARQVPLYNMYGPTEAAIDVAYFRCDADARPQSVPIGRPWPGAQLHVLDGSLQPVPFGVTGELYIGGVALARGYLGNPALTAQHFVPSPFAPGERLYRTGDLARRRTDGLLEFGGRSDHQVKLRGYRIELGEIEARLIARAGVAEAAVVLRETPAGKQLVAYVVADAALAETLREALRRELPEYMLPAFIVPLAALPRKSSGKLDPAALPAPDVAVSDQYVAPESEVERALAQIWRGVLGLERVGVNDNFFELGGDSIVSLQVVSRARQVGLYIGPQDVFRHQTLRALAGAARVQQPEVAAGPPRGEVALTPIQRVFFGEPMPARHHYNQSLLLQTKRPLEPRLLEHSLQALVAQHDALRLRFTPTDGGGWQQQYADTAEWTLQLTAASADQLDRLGDALQRGLDLQHGPLARAALFTLEDGSQRLLLIIHHLVVDGVSWRILLEDLERAYAALEAGEPVTFPARTASYQRWSEWLAAQPARTLRHVEEPAELPRDFPVDTQTLASVVEVGLSLSAEQTARLLRDAPKAYRTHINDLLLTALSRVLCRWNGQPFAVIELESHGRDAGDLDLSRSVGWFTQLQAIQLTPVAELAASIKAVKEQLRAAEPCDASARVTFNYLGQFDQSFARAGRFALAHEPCGASQDERTPLGNWLSIHGQVFGERLALNIRYSSRMYRHETIERLAASFARELDATIEHCTRAGVGGLTGSDCPLVSVTQAQLDRLPRAIVDVYPLSPLQQGLLFHSLYGDAPSDLYVSQLSVDVEGLDPRRFGLAWQSALARHEVLRTGFVELDLGAGLVQLVHEHATLPIEQGDARDGLDELARRERERPFDLAQPPLLRLMLVPLAAARHRLILTHHHVLLDGWSLARLLEEVLRSYAGEQVRTRPGSYRRYIAWLLARDRAADERFWKARLAELDAPSLLSGALLPSSDREGECVVRRQWSVQQTEQLQRFGRRERVTINTLVQGAWAVLLQRFTGQRSVAFGATVAGRPPELSGSESAVGLFINTVPVVLTPEPACAIGSYLRAVQDENLALREHEHAALSDIQRWAGRAGQPLFDSLIVFENYPIDRALHERGLQFGEIQAVDRTNYALTLELDATAQLGLKLKSSQLGAAQLGALAERFLQLLAAMIQDPGRALGSLGLASAPELQRLADWNATSAPLPDARNIHEWIEAQPPAAVALVCDGVSLTYAQLNARSNQLARHLRAAGVGPDVLVGVCARRSLELVVGLLAILKAGGAYVPLDPSYPRARLQSMIEDSGIALLIAQESLLASLPETAAAVWCIDRDWDDVAQLSAAPLPNATGPQHLAYCIYTSGSTGKPKGVQLTHWGLNNYLGWAHEAYRMAELDGSALHSSIAFDLTITSLWLPLRAGKRVELTRDDGDALAALASTLQRGGGSTLLKITPAHALALAELIERPQPQIEALIVGGEALSWECVAAIGRFAPNVRVINEYGPTETVVGCCIHDATVDADRNRASSAPIGSPIANTQLYVLDRCFQLCPVGVAGELCIGGGALARGYRGRPAATAERFVPNPFATAPGERLYRTGDLARQRADGVLEYLGRIDHQVKIRGYRIELGEIEVQLREHPAVREAVVLARETEHGKQLVAYVVADRPELERELQEQLRAVLPDYMLPARIVELAALPLTENGKLDRAALPAPDVRASAEYAEPEGATEQLLAGIFAAVLGSASVGRHDNFFDLGGDSILSLQIVSRARQAGLSIAPKDIFEQQTVEALARVAQAERAQPTPLPRYDFGITAEELAQLPATLEDVYPLSPIQQGMLFHALYSGEAGVYISQLSVGVEGLDVARFRAAFRAAIAARSILRTAFMEVGGERAALQVVLREAAVPIEELDWRERDVTPASLEALATLEQARGFDLRTPPLHRLVLVRTGERRHQLIWTHHHVLVDGWSNARLIEDVFGHYAHGALPERAGSFRDYVEWLQRQDLVESQHFWQSQLRALDEPTLLCGTLGRCELGEGHAQLSLEWSAEETAALSRFAQRERITLNTLLQGAWALLLQQYTGQRTVAFGATVAGRPASLPHAFELLGMFINTLPVVQTPSPRSPLGAWLRGLQDQNLALREHEHTPLYDVQRWVGRKGQALFDSILVFENYPLERVLQELAGGELRFDAGENSNPSHYPLSVLVYPGERLQIHYAYRRDRWDAQQVATIADHFRQLLLGCARSAGDVLLGTLSLAAQAEPTWRPRPQLPQSNVPERRVHQWVELHAREMPEQIAVVGVEGAWSYARLNTEANRLAHWLRAQAVGPDVVVGVCVERSLHSVLCVLAILKAGGAYLPLDPEYPPERLAYMIDSSGIALLLTQERLLAGLPESTVARFCVDRDRDVLAAFSDQNVESAPVPDNLAYCIFTSGSTGKPKAAENTHAALDNRLRWMQAEYALTPADRVLHKTPFGFDIAVAELLWPLRAGARIVLAPPGAQRDPAQLAAAIREHRVSVLDFVGSMLRAFVESGELESCASLRLVTTGAEEVPVELAREFATRHAARLVNEYGPTEAAVAVTHWQCSTSDRGAISPIGRPIDGCELYILNARMHPVPQGLSGELYIGGACLARGYRGRASLTAERFVPHPRAAQPGQRLYRTGDLARQRADGVFEYLGRVDQQVKIRGNRIELGEIEAQLRELAGVYEAVVVARELAGGKQLVAYVASQAPVEGLSRRLGEQLGRVLPAYMVPARIVVLDALPLTPHGKLDRKALPAPEVAENDAYVEPTSEIERQLAEIWSEVLGVPRVGTNDSFFALGGDSISSLRFVSRARQRGFSFTPKDVFVHPTIEALAKLAGDDGPANGDVPATPAQLWLRELGGRERRTLELGDGFDAALLEQALGHVVERHVMLRSPEAALELSCSPQLQVSVSALVADVDSLRILGDDLRRAYAQLRAGERVELGPQTSPFRLWAARIARLSSADPSEDLAFFREQLGEARTQSSGLVTLDASSGVELVAAFDEAQRAYRTQPEDLLLCALGRVLGDVVIGVERRFPLELDLSCTLGPIAHRFPVRLSAGATSLADSIKLAKEQLRSWERRAPMYGVLAQLADAAVRERVRGLRAPSVTFRHLGELEFAQHSQGARSEDGLSIETWLRAGVLHTDAHYASQRWSPREIEQLLGDYRAELAQLIEHCVRAESFGMTPSDVAGGQLDQQDIDALLEDLA